MLVPLPELFPLLPNERFGNVGVADIVIVAVPVVPRGSPFKETRRTLGCASHQDLCIRLAVFALRLVRRVVVQRGK